MDEQESSAGKVKQPDNLVTYDPDNPVYEKLRLCIYMAEMEDLKAELVHREETMSQDAGCEERD